MSVVVRLITKRLVAIVLLLSSCLVVAEDSMEDSYDSVVINEPRAKFNYQLFCQGCHTPDGMGGGGVPMLTDHIGYFLESKAGRSFLIQVPGSANSPLSDADLAEVLNWMIVEFAIDSLPEQWDAYSAEEVGEYRQQPLLEIIEYRRQLMHELMSH